MNPHRVRGKSVEGTQKLRQKPQKARDEPAQSTRKVNRGQAEAPMREREEPVLHRYAPLGHIPRGAIYGCIFGGQIEHVQTAV